MPSQGMSVGDVLEALTSVPLPDSDSDDDLERPTQRQRITFTPFSLPSFDKAAQLDGGDRAADLVDRPARDGASASRGGALGTGAQEDLAESASGDEDVIKSEVIDYKALATEHATTIVQRDATIEQHQKEGAKKDREILKLKFERSLLKRRWKHSSRAAKNGAAPINLGLSFEAARRLLMVAFKLIHDYAKVVSRPPMVFPYQEYMALGRALQLENSLFCYSDRAFKGKFKSANIVIHKALWYECARDSERMVDFTNASWLRMNPAAKVAWEQRMRAEVVEVGGTPFRKDHGPVVDPDPAGGDSSGIVDALAIQDNTFALYV
ncbi:oxidoreductase domain-containing protein [Pseudohyphozyma bogoriensis]|nr:oxidoreductase domain-containing protein [Pseudohyphozyma bogoriensis]